MGVCRVSPFFPARSFARGSSDHWFLRRSGLRTCHCSTTTTRAPCTLRSWSNPRVLSLFYGTRASLPSLVMGHALALVICPSSWLAAVLAALPNHHPRLPHAPRNLSTFSPFLDRPMGCISTFVSLSNSYIAALFSFSMYPSPPRVPVHTHDLYPTFLHTATPPSLGNLRLTRTRPGFENQRLSLPVPGHDSPRAFLSTTPSVMTAPNSPIGDWSHLLSIRNIIGILISRLACAYALCYPPTPLPIPTTSSHRLFGTCQTL